MLDTRETTIHEQALIMLTTRLSLAMDAMDRKHYGLVRLHAQGIVSLLDEELGIPRIDRKGLAGGWPAVEASLKRNPPKPDNRAPGTG